MKTNTDKYSDEAVFCVKYLAERGYLSMDKLTEIAMLLDDFDVDFNLVRVKKDFYTELAEALRKLWPPGEKDGKWPWRDSVPNLAKRLETLWISRNLKNYTIDDCLTVARRYLAQFENNVKYMKILKYFIIKQGSVMQKDGLIRYTSESTLADMLESLDSTPQDEWSEVFSTVDTGGELI